MEGEKVDLNKVVRDFCQWQERNCMLFEDNESLQRGLKSATRKMTLLGEAATAAQTEISQLRATVDKLQNIIAKKCDLEDECAGLREEICVLKETSRKVEVNHHDQIAEIMREMEQVSIRHEQELADTQLKSTLKWEEAIQEKEKLLQEKVEEVKQLQREKNELERARHTDIVKLRLECDGKMLKMQKQQQQMKTQANLSSSASTDIFRKKLQHLKAESDREIARLKKQMEDMEQQRPMATSTRTSKKLKLH